MDKHERRALCRFLVELCDGMNNRAHDVFVRQDMEVDRGDSVMQAMYGEEKTDKMKELRQEALFEWLDITDEIRDE